MPLGRYTPAGSSDTLCQMRFMTRRGTRDLPGFLQVTENWKKSGNLSGHGKVRGKYFFSEKSGKSQGK